MGATDGGPGGRQPTPTVTVFRDRPRLLTVYLVFGIALGIQGIAAGTWFATSGDDTEPGLRIVAIGLAAFVVFLGWWFAGQAWRRLRDADNPIAIGPAGLHDRALTSRPIPWADIRNMRVMNTGKGGVIVCFDLAGGAAERAGMPARTRMTAAVNRPFGYDFHIHTLGTDATVERLVGAIAPYAEVRRA